MQVHVSYLYQTGIEIKGFVGWNVCRLLVKRVIFVFHLKFWVVFFLLPVVWIIVCRLNHMSKLMIHHLLQGTKSRSTLFDCLYYMLLTLKGRQTWLWVKVPISNRIPHSLCLCLAVLSSLFLVKWLQVSWSAHTDFASQLKSFQRVWKLFFPDPYCSLLSVCRYNLSSKSWLTLDPSVNTVAPRYGHSLALHEVCEWIENAYVLWKGMSSELNFLYTDIQCH